MDERETTRLFRFLGELYPAAPEYHRKESMLAWQMVLAPFDYDAVKAATVEWARASAKREHPPRVSEIAAKLIPAALEDAPKRSPDSDPGFAWQAEIDAGRCKDAADTPFSVSRYAREHGLTWQEARADCQRLELIAG